MRVRVGVRGVEVGGDRDESGSGRDERGRKP